MARSLMITTNEERRRKTKSCQSWLLVVNGGGIRLPMEGHVSGPFRGLGSAPGLMYLRLKLAVP